MSFNTVLFGGKEDFAKDANVIVKQDNVIKAYQMIIPTKGEKMHLDKGQTTFNVIFIFLKKILCLIFLSLLTIITTDRKEYNFYFDVEKIK